MSNLTPTGVKLAEMKAAVKEEKSLRAKEKMTRILGYPLVRQHELHLQNLPGIRQKALRWSLKRVQRRRSMVEEFLFGETSIEYDTSFISSMGVKGDKVPEVEDTSHKEKQDLCSNNSSGEIYKGDRYNFGDTYIGPIFTGGEREHTTMNYF